ncbi:PKD domain-containing protein [Chitinophaga sp. GbtcB8]|uniref:PKD domain-containing protein n=1 Tax=Chitinophaga sp. GbtcB8 TaxID=2824753 RepID=UPI001C2FF863|nr:PKD domain-containing protein [Chitinophaga sp. GbtcB8]
MKRFLLLFVFLWAHTLLFGQSITVDFSSDKTIGCGPLTVSFQDLSTGPNPITAWRWNFGDGDTSTLQNPVHIYTLKGRFRVSLTVWDNMGNKAIKDNYYYPNYISVQPSLNIGDEYLLCNIFIGGASVKIANKATDPNGPAFGSYLWSTGDTTSSILVNTPGTYSVTYEACGQTLQDNANVSQTSTHTEVTIDSPAVTNWYVGYYNRTLKVNIPYNTEAIDRCFIDWKDGTIDEITNRYLITNINLNRFSHKYQKPGNYQATFTARLKEDDRGYCDTLQFITVPVRIPAATVDLGSDTTLYKGDTLILDAGNPGARYSWWGNYDGSAQTVTVISSGYYGVHVFKDNDIMSDSLTITFIDPPPNTMEAKITVWKQSCRTAWFLDSTHITAGTIKKWEWNFGDSTTSTAMAPDHAYTQDGTYNVRLIVTNNYNQRDTAYTTVIINTIPVVELGADSTLASGDSLRLDAHKPENSGDATYLWSTGSTQPAIVVYTSGSYWVKVSSCGSTVADTIVVTIPDTVIVNNPTAQFTADKQQCTTVRFTDQSTTAAGTTITSRQWSFGDNTTDTAQNPLHTYSQRGEYTVSLVVMNSAGKRDTATTTIYFAPLLVTLGADTTLVAGDSLLLDARKPNNSGDTYLWSTGSTQPEIVVYTSGSYWVKVSSCGSTVTDTINIKFANPAGINAAIGIWGRNCTSVHFGDESTAIQPIVKWEWSFGDGTTDTTQSPQHLYAADGQYLVRLVVTGSQGATDTATRSVELINKPNLELGADITLYPGDSVMLGADFPNTTRTWSTGETGPIITITAPGTYSVTVYYCNGSVSDTIRILQPVEPENPASVGNTTTVNANDSLAITASFNHSFNSNNVFIIQLLQGTNTGGKKAGELDGTVTNLATVPGTDPRISVKVSIPDTIPCGQDYRVRIVSSSPADTTDWSSKFAVVNTPVATLQQRGDSLFAGKALTYQWYFNGAALTAATTAAIRAKANGQYYVIVSNGGTCRSTSTTVNMVITAVPDVTVGENVVRAFPNPTAGLVYVRFEKPLLKPVDIIVHDTKGNTLYRKQVKDQLTEIDLGTLPKGIYHLEVAGYGKQKAMRIILQ